MRCSFARAKITETDRARRGAKSNQSAASLSLHYRLRSPMDDILPLLAVVNEEREGVQGERKPFFNRPIDQNGRKLDIFGQSRFTCG